MSPANTSFRLRSKFRAMSPGKRILFLALGLLNMAGWGSLAVRWSGASAVTVAAPAAAWYQKPPKELSRVTAMINPRVVDLEKRELEVSMYLVVPDKAKLSPDGFQSLVIYSAHSVDHQDQACIVGWDCMQPEPAPPLPVITLDARGWYPFETYSTGVLVNVWYGDQLITIKPMMASKGSDPLEPGVDDLYAQFQVDWRQSGEYWELRLSEPLNERIQYLIIMAMLIGITFGFLLIDDFSTLMQATIALLVGLWGLGPILIPSSVPLPARFGSEEAIVYCYLYLGLTLCLWLFEKWASVQGWQFFTARTADGVTPFPSSETAAPGRVLPKTHTRDAPERYLSTKEAAVYFGVSITTLRRLVRKGEIVATKIKGRWAFPVDTLRKRGKHPARQ